MALLALLTCFIAIAFGLWMQKKGWGKIPALNCVYRSAWWWDRHCSRLLGGLLGIALASVGLSAVSLTRFGLRRFAPVTDGGLSE
ncbi:MAG TPA: hypothetical protein PKM78_08530 [Anaerolineae bacterium]|nr:hypothetical protein [Anaerolineae bacterium]HNU03977.1 hypothetical protein [Anaerolineae bacterium]